MQEYETLAAVDLGSNSFHLQVGRVDGEQLFYLDAHKEAVRLAAGLTDDKRLDAAAQRRALDCLARFGERLRGLPPGAVRAVGTSALRQAKNAAEFLDKARAALGFDIDIVAGREEARLIYLGVAHSLPSSEAPRLVVDIGGGSTEVIVGCGHEPGERESLRMGCVVFGHRFFPTGELSKAAFRAAETAAGIEVQAVARQFMRNHWQEAVGSSGSARALGEILAQNGESDGSITAGGLKWLRSRLIRAGHIDRLDLPGLKADRKPVIAGGFAIMSAVFGTLDIDTMTVAQGAMREGILWDLLGRVHDDDLRDVTVRQFTRRYHIDGKQARRVERTALALYRQCPEADNEGAHFLSWAARLHEVGISIAHASFHKHGAYILENADMPGFSRREQQRLATLVRASRGGLGKAQLPDGYADWSLVLCLRLAVLLNQSRADQSLTLGLVCTRGNCTLKAPDGWLEANPLTRAALLRELDDWLVLAGPVKLVRVLA